jgi:hypothetical protein
VDVIPAPVALPYHFSGRDQPGDRLRSCRRRYGLRALAAG